MKPEQLTAIIVGAVKTATSPLHRRLVALESAAGAATTGGGTIEAELAGVIVAAVEARTGPLHARIAAAEKRVEELERQIGVGKR